MTDAELLEKLKSKSGDDLYPLVTQAELAEAEHRLGFALLPLHRRVLLDVGNGGRVLHGLYGIPAKHGGNYDDGRSLIEMREMLTSPGSQACLAHAVPLSDLGCAQWVWVDCEKDRVLVMADGIITVIELTMADLAQAWLEGRMQDVLFAPAPSTWGVNPFTKERTEFKRFKPRGKQVYSIADEPFDGQ